MRVLLINPILYTADNNVIPKFGSIKDCMIYNLGLGFKKLGHEVTLIAAEDYRPTTLEEYEYPVLFFKSNLSTIFLPSVLPLMLGLLSFLKINRGKYDLIVSSELFSFSSLFAAIFCPNKTLVWHELAVHNKKFKYLPSKIWYNIIVPVFFRKINVVPRSVEASEFIKRYKLLAVLAPVEHGVNLTKFNYSILKKKQFIIVSQLIKRKNICSIISIYKEFIDDFSLNDYKLLIVGQGDLQDELKAQIQMLGLGDRVELLGYKPHSELNKLMSESIALLINTVQDNNMVSIPEAIVSGTPVLTNDVPTNAPMIKTNGLGLVRKDWGVEELKEIVENNNFYVKKCVEFRDALSVESTAQNLINAFVNENPSCK